MPENSETCVMGFDYGTRRIGVAVGQGITKTASPLTTLDTQTSLWPTITKLIEQWQPQRLIVGIPTDMYDREQPITQAARDFAQTLAERFPIPVTGVDERLTTRAAQARIDEHQRQTGLPQPGLDAVAAQLMVEQWLNN